jgi:hypothetical protein
MITILSVDPLAGHSPQTTPDGRKTWVAKMIVDGLTMTDLVYATDRMEVFSTLNMAYRENRL